MNMLPCMQFQVIMHVQLYAVPITSMYGIEGRASAPHVVSLAASPTSSASLLVETVEEVALARLISLSLELPS